MASADVFGRVEQGFSLYSESGPSTLEAKINTMLRSIRQDANPLNTAFFSQGNLNYLQRRIQEIIKEKTDMEIARQSDDQLLIVMRNIYMQKGALQVQDVKAEVARLNGRVLKAVIPIVGSGLAGYLVYLRDASQMPVPLARGEQTSVKGSKTASLFRGF